MLPEFALARPTAVAEALGLLSDDAVAYWGGTELLLAMKMGLLTPSTLVDLKRVDGLRGIEVDGGQLLIGAGATHDEIARHPLVTEHVPLLADAESRVGNARVRAQGTIGGNLCFAEPRSDIATILMALDGSVTLRSASGERLLPIGEFVLGPYWTAREPNELLLSVAVPLPAARGVYVKFQVTERPTVGVAALTSGEGNCRVVVGAVGDVPRVFDSSSWDDVDPEAIAAELEPVSDLTGSVEYKRHVTAVFVRRAVEAVRREGER